MLMNSKELSNRIANCLPAGTFELEIFCQLVGIEASREVESAAVQGSLQPRMLINPDFIEKYCRRDEHLFLLVMHELWHILLGHTRLFPRATLIDNIAFDAVINAGLTLQFPEAEYRGFLEEIYNKTGTGVVINGGARHMDGLIAQCSQATCHQEQRKSLSGCTTRTGREVNLRNRFMKRSGSCSCKIRLESRASSA